MIGELLVLFATVVAQESHMPRKTTAVVQGQVVSLYPNVEANELDGPSPLTDDEGGTLLHVQLLGQRHAWVEAGLKAAQGQIDAEDFPVLAARGVHDHEHLADTRQITGVPISQINDRAQPGALSSSGFLAAGEDVLITLMEDDRRVRALGLTHAQLAEPLFHVINVLDQDVGVVYRNHSFDELVAIRYGGHHVFIKGEGTKGGQKSIFDDGIEGALDLDIWRPLSQEELCFLREAYPNLRYGAFSDLARRLSHLHTGEMEPQYIMRYGFYEGHTEYRTDPLTIAVVFGLKRLQEVEAAFKGRLPQVLTQPYVPSP